MILGLSARNSSTSAGCTFMEFETGDFTKICPHIPIFTEIGQREPYIKTYKCFCTRNSVGTTQATLVTMVTFVVMGTFLTMITLVA
jgi:hypothetical protein